MSKVKEQKDCHRVFLHHPSQGYSNYRYFRTGPHTLINESNFLDIGGIYSYFNSIEFHPNNYYTIITHHAGQYPTGNTNLNLWKRSLIKTEDNGNSISIVKTFTNQVFREKISIPFRHLKGLFSPPTASTAMVICLFDMR